MLTSPPVRILITNDDGIHSEGLHVLAEVAAEFGETIIVAPDRDQSGVSHAITLSHPLRVRETAPRTYAIEGGTPTDCVYVGLHHILRGELPDLVVSGINPGPNLGWDVLYSGTVAAAREAVLKGVPGLALSLISGGKGYPFREVMSQASAVIKTAISAELPEFTFLNCNIPNPRVGPVTGIRGTTLGHRFYSTEIVVRQDPRGRDYLWIGGSDVRMPDMPGSDCNAVREGFVSVSPLTCNVTCPVAATDMTSWNQDF